MINGPTHRRLHRLVAGAAALLVLLTATACTLPGNARDTSGGAPSPVKMGFASAGPALPANPGGVSINCGTKREDHEVYMTAWNSSAVDQTCTATCYYRDSKGEIGSLTGTQRIPANASAMPFASRYDPAITFQVINPGMAECSTAAGPARLQP